MWIICFALPNINIGEPIGDDNIAIVPHNDSRIIEIIRGKRYARTLVENFEDQFGRKVYPSFMIINEAAPKHVSNAEVIVGFRNIVAMSIIIRAHEHILTSKSVWFPLYSDYFDFYPITVSKHDDGFVTQSPSISAFDDEIRKFTGQTSPSLADPTCLRFDPTGHLFDQLYKVWERCYLRRRYSVWPTRTLFRSLQMAYQASTMPFKNWSTIYDYGVSASLWVSAFETVAHSKKTNTSLLTVVDLMNSYKWLEKCLKRRTYLIKYARKKTRVNLSQRLYKELYDTRNAFLHGNPVTVNRLRPFKNKNAKPITMFAPLLYKVALLSYLSKLDGVGVSSNSSKGRIQSYSDQRRLSNALMKARNPD